MDFNQPTNRQLITILEHAQSCYQTAALYAACRLGLESSEAQGRADEAIQRVMDVLRARG